MGILITMVTNKRYLDSKLTVDKFNEEFEKGVTCDTLIILSDGTGINPKFVVTVENSIH
jgi:hypothetical protein